MNISYLWSRVYNLLADVCLERREALKGSDTTEDLDTFKRDVSKEIFYVKSVGSNSTDVLELCSAFNFMMDCFPIENYIEIAKDFLPRILINLLNLMIDNCDILRIDEYFVLTKVVANIFSGVNTLHRDNPLLTGTELPRTNLNNQVPTSITGLNQIPLVAEDEEYSAEEAGELSNDTSNNTIEEGTGGGGGSVEKSLSENAHSIAHSNQSGQYDKGGQLTIDSLIEKFQSLFHNFVVSRLLKHCDTHEVYEKLSKALSERHMTRDRGFQIDARIPINANLVEVHESLCGIFSLIATIPVNEEAFLSPKPTEPVQSDDRSSKLKSANNSGVQNNQLNNDANLPKSDINTTPETLLDGKISQGVDGNTKDAVGDSDQLSIEHSKCRPYVRDLMLLSYAIDDTRINYSSMNLLLNMLTSSKLALDSEFARANLPIGVVAPSFSEELNASVVGDTPLMFERRSSESEGDEEPKRLLLTNEDFYFITEHTCWFSLAMEILWQYLSTEPMHRLETVDIIQNMHNLTYQTLACEDIICASLNDGDEKVAYEARRKFILLFSLMKNDRSSLDLKQREFERPLFFILDSLANKMDPFNCIARDWLSQVYKFKTTARVLEPILRIALHPDTARTPIIFTKINISSIHHTHMHLYSQIYDSQRILYALNTLWNVLTTDPHQGLIRMANSSVKGSHELHLLYARHANALAGGSFHDEVTVDNRASQVPSFLELTIITCLNFLSSYYMTLPTLKLTQADIHGNQKVRMLSCEILRTIFSNLFDAIKGCPTQPIHDMLNRCKAQETILLHIAVSVQRAQHMDRDSQLPSSSEQLIQSNETIDDNPDDFQRTLLRLLEELMILEYRVAPPNVISETENHSRSARTRDIPDISSNSLKYFYNILISSQRLFLAAVKAALQNIHRSDLHLNWLSMIETTIPISGRSLTRWIGCVISRLCDNLEMISNCILDRSEPANVNMILTPKYLLILMNSLTHLTHHCLLDNSYRNYHANGLSQRSESLSTLLPSTINAISSSGGVNSGSTTTLTSTGTSGPSSLGPVSHVMSNIFHVFSNDQGQDSAIGSQAGSGLGQNDPIIVARKEVLNKLSQIIFALIQVWKAMGHDRNSWLILGSPADVKKQILALLSPISLRHGVQFMNAVAFVWHELRSKNTGRKDVIPPCSPDQSLLVEIVASISDLPMESVLQTTRQVISKTQESRNLHRAPLEVGLLQFFLAYIRLFPGSQLIECWKPLLQLLRDGLQLGRPAMPQAQFTLLALLHEFVQTAPLIEDRKDQKDLQDVAQRLIDSLTTVVGARLAQTRWLRRALEVEPGPQHEISEDEEASEACAAGARSLQMDAGSIFSGESRSSEHFTDADSAITTTGASLSTMVGPQMTNNSSSNNTISAGGSANGNQGSTAATLASSSAPTTTTMASAAPAASTASASDDNNSYLARYSVQALNALAEYVAPVLDVVYASDEKEKVVNLINSIMYYVNPYLKNHHVHNSPSFLACSHLLSSISGYQYTRKAWRKDALELLLDPQFFQMDPPCLEHWRVIVDHLMTHDKTTFRDFLSRMSLNQSGGALKLFASRDQENEQRAQLIKRMAFILFCSERDQYHKYTPEIQEKLIESLRDNPSDLVQSQIMLCFRVLIIRSSAHLLTSLWPFVYTEMVQGLLDIEAYLEQSIAAVSAASTTPAPSANSSTPTPGSMSTASSTTSQLQQQAGLQNSPSTAARFQLFLYTCKLLDMVLALPADSLPQFQMYRWSFIGSGDDFEPHLVRIERRLSELSKCPNLLPYRNHYPILTFSKIGNLLALHPFFKTLVKVNRNEYDASENLGDQAAPLSPTTFDDPIKFIDAILESDFLVQ
uniref:Protein pad-1 n=1 Tax=Aceria tosichella TaxID=561515 RepID=A0A6G1SL09_9ACAR